MSDNETIRSYLARKDTDFSDHVPASYRMTKDQKKATLFLDAMSARYAFDRASSCIEPCFNNMESPVVSQIESDCMTNCTTKALETLAHFNINYSAMMN